MQSLPHGDHTPANYTQAQRENFYHLKKVIRSYVYPLVNYTVSNFLLKPKYKYSFKNELILWGQRGNDYERQRRRLNRFKTIKGSVVLIAGCGSGKDLSSWLSFEPKKIIGVDLFRYDKAWNLIKTNAKLTQPRVEIDFLQSFLESMSQIPDASVDIVSSDAVLEHIKNMPEVLKEFHRILKKDGVFYSTFGPLWYSWGGDHVSGFENVYSGYNHLILGADDYKKYLDQYGQYEHNEDDGRTWINNDLFSRLKPEEYLENLEQQSFSRIFVASIIDPRAIECLKYPPLTAKLKVYKETDLITSGMTIIYGKK